MPLFIDSLAFDVSRVCI